MSEFILSIVAGTAVALLAFFAQLAYKRLRAYMDYRKIKEVLHEHTRDESGYAFASTPEIASWSSLSEERVDEICSERKDIHLSTRDGEKRWSTYRREEGSVYENRGILRL